MDSIYDKSETMKLLGKQCYSEIVTDEDLKAIDEIVNISLSGDRPDISMIKYDLFVYGYLMGKRAERKRRQRNK